MNPYRIATLALLALCFASQAFAGSNEHPNAEQAMKLAYKAQEYVLKNGQKQSVRVFNDPTGPFVRGELYVLYYDFEGNCIANGGMPELSGTNRLHVTDPDGTRQVEEMIRIAKNGGGWVRYKFNNPLTGEVEPKATFVLPVPGQRVFVGCGVYGEP